MDADETVVTVSDDDDIRHIAARRRAIIKMHGSLDDGYPAEWLAPGPVITRGDYENYETRRPRTWNVLRAPYLGRRFLFLGFSFTDPNVEILQRLARTTGTAQADQHIAVMRRPSFPHPRVQNRRPLNPDACVDQFDVVFPVVSQTFCRNKDGCRRCALSPDDYSGLTCRCFEMDMPRLYVSA